LDTFCPILNDKETRVSIGAFLENLLTDDKYMAALTPNNTTVLPRIPT